MKPTRFTLDDLKQSACAKLNGHLFEVKKTAKQAQKGGKIVSKVYPQESKEKMAMEYTLFDFTQHNCIKLYAEYRFHETRKWRFDWYFELHGRRYAVEYNGIMSKKSRHTTVGGYSGDMEKINAAQALGITVFQYTPLNYRQLLNELEKLQ